MRILIAIPARYFSSRFPGKVLYPILGKPMIQWVWEGSKESKLKDEVLVLTDSERIEEAVSSFGGEARLIKGDFRNGTERIGAFIENKDYDIVVNVQGDEPLVEGEIIDGLISAFIHRIKDVSIATLAEPVSLEEAKDPNVVKVVKDKDGRALYFSRSLIPYPGKDGLFLKHIGIYAYTKEALLLLSHLPPSSLEKTEKLEQLRALENGYDIMVFETKAHLIGVDVLEDVKRVEKVLMGR
ncbi:MAG: 3-deoxy-manno-octulosonate cytidylyltransferase [Deltaproteobacteria bacterium]|nr:3-deoxy-manno-octulosonate cytidylyltransferase [Deltaproteobacteria bacterium]